MVYESRFLRALRDVVNSSSSRRRGLEAASYVNQTPACLTLSESCLFGLACVYGGMVQGSGYVWTTALNLSLGPRMSSSVDSAPGARLRARLEILR
jgi:hypothetical protein